MAEWLSSACQVFGVQSGAAAAIACIALAVLLVAFIVLGFGPLRARFGPAVSGRAQDDRPAVREEGLIATWQLYRQLGRVRSPRR